MATGSNLDRAAFFVGCNYVALNLRGFSGLQLRSFGRNGDSQGCGGDLQFAGLQLRSFESAGILWAAQLRRCGLPGCRSRSSTVCNYVALNLRGFSGLLSLEGVVCRAAGVDLQFPGLQLRSFGAEEHRRSCSA